MAILTIIGVLIGLWQVVSKCASPAAVVRRLRNPSNHLRATLNDMVEDELPHAKGRQLQAESIFMADESEMLKVATAIQGEHRMAGVQETTVPGYADGYWNVLSKINLDQARAIEKEVDKLYSKGRSAMEVSGMMASPEVDDAVNKARAASVPWGEIVSTFVTWMATPGNTIGSLVDALLKLITK